MLAFYSSILLVAFVTLCQASSQEDSSSQLRILQAPNYFQFDSGKCPNLKASDIVNLILATEGSQIEKSIDCVGMSTTDTKSIPAAIFLFLAENKYLDASSLGNLVTYNVVGDHVDLKRLDMKYLDIPNAANLKEVNFECLQRVVVVRIGQSANELINSTLEKFSADCPQDTGNTLALIWNNVTFTDLHTRTKRQATGGDSANKITNVAEFYMDQYPAIFNILFWTSLILGIAVFAITYNMWFMDPGLDTVIYRMTSQRIKKDQ